MSPQPRKRRGLAMWLASSATPLFVVDGRRRVVFFNSGCEQLTGWTAGEVIGQVCDFVSHPEHTQVESLTGILCPPPEAFEGLEQAVPALVVTRSGERLARLIRFFPLLDEEHRAERVLGTFSTFPQPSSHSPASLDHPLHAELSALKTDLRNRYSITTLVGRSPGFRRLLQQVELACRHTGSVHLQGEPGTGKEHLARLIHFQGESRRRAFVPLDVALLTRSELSETVKRVLRDARDAEPTRLTPGTLYLKDVDQLPDTIQEVLVQECGCHLQTRFCDQPPDTQEGHPPPKTAGTVRLMSSSIAGLKAAVRDDNLSEEFCHLLTTQHMLVPPLRDRPEDIPLLGQYFLEAFNRDEEAQLSSIAEDVWIAFRKYSWPGNLDELRTVIAEARANCDHHTILASDLPFRFRAGMEAQSAGPSRPVEVLPLEDKLAEVERAHIRLALDQAGHNKSQAAQLLGMTRPRLYRRMQFLGLVDANGEPDDSGKDV